MAGDSDISLVRDLTLTYWHTYTADDDMLRFTAKGKRRLTIDGFSNSQIRVLDITDPNNVQEVTTSVEQNGSYSVSLSVPTRQQRTLLAFTVDRISRTAEVIAERPSNLRRSPGGADLVIITAASYSTRWSLSNHSDSARVWGWPLLTSKMSTTNSASDKKLRRR